MSSHDYPFVEVEDEDGLISRAASAYLPVRITNPHSGESVTTMALIDTGADACVFPASLAELLDHNVQGRGVYTEEVTGISGLSTVYIHTFNLEILMPNQQDVVQSFERILVKCSNQQIPPLLGVRDCLCHFKLTIDYLQKSTTLSN